MNIDFKGGASSYTKGIVVGALLGGAVSSVVALLFAPKKGSDFRRDIAEKTGETYNNIASKAGHLAQDAANRVGTFVESIQSRGEYKTEKAIANGSNGHAAPEHSTQAAASNSANSKSANS